MNQNPAANLPPPSNLETQQIEVGHGVLRHAAALFQRHFGDRPAMLVADVRVFEAAGRTVADAFRQARHPLREPFLFHETDLYAEHSHVSRLEGALAGHDAIPMAVGAGTLNDLVKLAAHRAGRPYAAVGTAASMDGYTAFGASITWEGSKQTFACPAPVLVLADLDVLCAAPPELNAAGYADLLAKVPAGADWLLADALGEEGLDPEAWDAAQGGLRRALDDPEGVRLGHSEAIRRLTEGLLATGLAMQRSRSSRPASGAEHQFSHLWDMQGHRHEGRVPLHGFKVGIGSLAVTRLYEALLAEPLEALDVERCVSGWPPLTEMEREVERLFPEPALARKAREETTAKWLSPEALRAHLERLRAVWPELRPRLRAQLLPERQLRERLERVGAPTRPEEIGISRERLRASHRQAYHLRRRYTVLDLAVRTGGLEGE